MKADEPINALSEEETDRIDEGVKIYKGLTVRDHIAIEAMNGMLVNVGRNQFAYHKPDEISKVAYSIADAMIAESQKVLEVKDE